MSDDDEVTNPENKRPRRPQRMTPKEGTEQMGRSIEVRIEAVEEVVLQVAETQGEMTDRLERLERAREEDRKLLRDLVSTLGAVATESQTIRKALYRNNMVPADENAQCDEAWNGVESWPTNLETAETVPSLNGTEAQRRETLREKRLRRRGGSLND